MVPNSSTTSQPGISLTLSEEGLGAGPPEMFWKGMEGKMEKHMAEKKLRGFLSLQ